MEVVILSGADEIASVGAEVVVDLLARKPDGGRSGWPRGPARSASTAAWSSGTKRAR